MIRVLYWIMALIEFIILLGTVLLFVVSDSRTIDIVSKDILPKYGITYQKIDGNIFTGIQINSLEYNNTKLADNINIHWNPIDLLDNTIHITKLEIKSLNSNKIKEILDSLPKSDNSSKVNIFFDYKIDHIDITAKPLNYHGVEFRDFELGMKSIRVDRDMQKIKGKLLKLSINSSLVNIGLHGEINKKRLHLNRVSLTNIDTKVITKFIKSFKTNNKKRVKKDTPPILEYIKIDKLLVSLKKITYSPITLEKTRLTLSNITINPKSSYNINAKKAILIGETNFANTKQIGYIKNSKLYTKGDIITKKYLFDKYNLPLNRKELKKLPTKLELNQKGIWIEINHSAKKILTNRDFNLNLKKATHKLKYIYNEDKIYIHSKAKSSMTYSDNSDIDNLVLIDIAKNGYTTYEGKIDVKRIKGIPKNISSNLLKNLKLKYKGDSKKLSVNIDSKQIKGAFITKGYKNAKLTFHTKKGIYINRFIKNLPKPFNNSLADISSNSFIDFKNNKKTKIGLNIHSNIININTHIGIIQPFKIKFDATIPHNSKIYKNIKLQNISKLNGLITLNKNGKSHISIKNRDLSLSCNFNSKIDRLSRGVLDIASEEIRFYGGLNKSINITTQIENLNRFTKTVMKYYNIKLQKIRGKADINIKLNPNSINISLKSKKIEYGDIQGDLISKIDIDKKNSKIDIKLSSKEIKYIDKTNQKPTKIHMLSAKFSILDNKIEIDRYSFRFYNDYISHFYSNKKSYLNLYNGTLYIKKVWLNDNILIKGDYNINSMLGNLNLVSNNFSFKNRDFDLLSKFNLNLEIDKHKLFLSGLVEPLGNKISYKAIGSGIEEDSDIIIVQDNSQKNSTILDNLKMNIRIKNQKPIRYKTDNIDIEFSNDITIIKDYFKDFKVLGTTTINRGYYKQENKNFFLDKSYIYFSGNPKKPILEIKATYNKEQYNIQIFISGTTQDPIINFNSNPYLTQKEILSLILFDSTGENSGSGTEAYALLGGTFAKELMKSLGISVDHLVLGQGIDEQLSVEVGKKISKDITLIYLHNNGKDGVKVRVDHSRHIETDIILQPQSSSVELLYKSD